MSESRIKKTSYNMLSLGLYELINFAYQLIIPALIIRTFGSAYNGVVSSITQFLSYIQLLTLGIAGPVRVALYGPLARKDSVQISGVVNASEQYMRKVGMILIVYIGVIALVFPYFSSDGFSHFEIATLAVAIGLSSVAAYFFGTTYQNLLMADQKLYVYNLFKSAITSANIIFGIILIKSGGSIQLVKFASGIVCVLGLVFLNKHVAKKYQIDKSIPPDKSFFSQRRDALGHSIANMVHSNTDIVVITIMCDLKVVSVYTVYQIVMNALRQLLSVFTTGSEAVFGNMIAKGENDKIHQGLSVYEHLVYSFVAIVFSATMVLLIPFVSLYTKGVTDIDYVIPAYALVITIAQALFCIRTPYLTLTQAAGHYKQTKSGAYAEAIINISLSVLLTIKLGIIGTAIGTLVANLFRTIQYVLYVQFHLVRRRWTIYIKRIVFLLISMGLSCLICSLIVKNMASVSWVLWIMSGVISVFLSTGVVILLGWIMFKDDSKYMKHVVKVVLSRR